MEGNAGQILACAKSEQEGLAGPHPGVEEAEMGRHGAGLTAVSHVPTYQLCSIISELCTLEIIVICDYLHCVLTFTLPTILYMRVLTVVYLHLKK